MRIITIGCGYVGLTTSLTLAYIGHQVHCIDQDEEKISALQKGRVPIYETGSEKLMAEVRDRLSFGQWDSFKEPTDVVMIAVGTPRKENGDVDLSHIEAVARELGNRLSGPDLPIIVNKSTVPIGSAQWVESIISHHLRKRGIWRPVLVASNPEFLREGNALFDAFYPDRIVIGANDPPARDILSKMYAPVLSQTFTPPGFLPRPEGFKLPALITISTTSAELIKYAANSYLAMKISYINEIAGLAEKVGADIKEVARGIGLDKRIGILYLNAGIGWGGGCFGKDAQALIHMASQYGYDMPLSKATVLVNIRQREEVIKKLQAALKVLRGSTVGLLGLSFKPDTDDFRDAPSIAIANRLIELGAHVKAYDPVSLGNCRKSHPDLAVEYVTSPEELATGVDALVLVTEWKEFLCLPFAELKKIMRRNVIVDGRNVLNGKALIDLGFNYIAMGR